jgi:ABC-type branched-subunit amino acid transport system substrate-binding protein
MMRTGFLRGLLQAAAAVLVLACPGWALSAESDARPIVIGYIGDLSSPGTRPSLEIQQMAVEEINAAGGIAGRPVKYLMVDGKGGTSLSVEGARRLLVEERADVIFVEGRSEICLAAQENSAAMFREYPHVMIFNGPMASELTGRIVDDYERYRFCFRDWVPAAHYAWLDILFDKTFRQAMGARKVAILWEDLTWTEEFRKGVEYLGLPPWKDVAEKRYGLEVVYSKAVKPRGTLYLPILQQMAMQGAEVILYVSSWFTDTETFAKQWADSAARDIPVVFYGGASHTHAFWRMTGGKALGVVTPFYEGDIPYTEKTVPFIEKARKRGIPLQIHVHLAYADIYHIKAAVEEAGGTDDIDRLIEAMERVETTFSLGRMSYETQRIKPFFHSKVLCDPRDPYRLLPGYFMLPVAQIQHEGKIAWIAAPGGEEVYARFMRADGYLPPKKLRQPQ